MEQNSATTAGEGRYAQVCVISCPRCLGDQLGAPERLPECAWHFHGCCVMFFGGSEKCLMLSPVNQDKESLGEKPG